MNNYSDEDDSAIFSKRPRQCLPYAIATFRVKQNILQPSVITKSLAPTKQSSKPVSQIYTLYPVILYRHISIQIFMLLLF